MYKISIIIPVFNTEKELEKTLKSIINQTMKFEEIEVILINDGSTDNSGKIMDSYSEKYKNIISIHLDKNCGSPGKPRNIGIKYATAPYVMFQDSDDIYTSYACEYLYDIMKNDDVDIAGGMLTIKNKEGEDQIPYKKWTSIIDKSKDEKKIKEKRVYDLLTDDKLFKLKLNSIDENLDMLNDSGFTSKIYKKTFLEKHNITFPEGLRGGEDAVFLFNCMLNASGIVFINKIISHYNTQRTGENKSLSHDKSIITVTSRLKSYKIMYDLSTQHNKEEIFIKYLLNVKLHYWFINHLISSNINTPNLINILNEGKPLFKHSIKYAENTPNYLFKIYTEILNNEYYNAIKTINKKRIKPKFLISVIIPVFNAEDTLYNAFESLFKQSIGFENIEILFIDDCSTDQSKQIIKEFAEKYENIKYYSSDKNSGYAGKPRNIGIENATSDYLMFLDPDDIYLENACEVLFRNIINNNLDMVSANYNINRNSNITRNNWNYIGLKDMESKHVQTIDEFHKLLMPPASVWAKIFKREFIINNNIKFLVGVPAQDLVFVSESLLKANGIKFINTPIVEYIPREKGEKKSTTATRNKTTLLGFIKSYTKLYNLLYNHNPEYTWLSTRNLHFWTKQFILSNLKINDKIDLLYYANFLFEDFIKSEKLNPSAGLEKFFDLISKKEFLNAARLSEKLSYVYDNSEIIRKIKNKKIIFLLPHLPKNDKLIKDYYNFANELNKHDYDTYLINFDYLEELEPNINKIEESINNPQSPLINIYKYYLNKNIDNNIDIIPQIESLSNNEEKYTIKKTELTKNMYVLNYIEKSSNEIKKSEVYIYEYLTIIKNYSQNQKCYEDFYTPQGYNYLSITHLHKKIAILSDKTMKFKIQFKNEIEFQKYFLTELITKQDEDPFIIIDDMKNLHFLNEINSKLIILLTKKDLNKSFKELESILKEKYIEKTTCNITNKKSNNINTQLINQITQENKKLNEENKKLYIKNQNLKEKTTFLTNQINKLKQNNQHEKNKWTNFLKK